MIYRFRIPYALAAAALIVAVIGAGVLTLNSLRSAAPAAHVGSTSLQQFESRPLNLPVLKSGDPCPVTAASQEIWGGDSGIYGTPPVGVGWAGFGWPDTWGKYWDMFAITAPSVNGALLIRGRDLRTGQDLIFVGKWAAGTVVATDPQWDPPNMPLRPELFLDPRQPTHELTQAGLAKWSFVAGVGQGGSGCIGLQVDGSGPTRTIVAALPV